MAYIERAITSVLKSRLSASKCLLLTGARQVGKSTLIKHVFPDFNSQSCSSLIIHALFLLMKYKRKARYLKISSRW